MDVGAELKCGARGEHSMCRVHKHTKQLADSIERAGSVGIEEGFGDLGFTTRKNNLLALNTLHSKTKCAF